MKVVIPNKLDVLESSALETDALDGSAWNVATAYAMDARVRHNHVRYIAIAENTDKQPDLHCKGTEAAWIRLGPTNRYAMIDDLVSTQTVAPAGETELSFTVPFNRATSFALLNLYASDVAVVIRDDQGEVFFEREYSMVEDLTSFSLFQYCFYPIEASSLVMAANVPMPILGSLQVTLRAAESPAIGHVVAGRAYYVGQTQYGAGIGELDYSRKVTDDFGVTEFIPRGYANSMSLSLFVESGRFDATARLMKQMRALPSLWIGDNSDDTRLESLIVYGWKQDFRQVYEDYGKVMATLEISGLI